MWGRLVALLAVAALFISVFAACGNGEQSAAGGGGGSPTATATVEEQEPETRARGELRLAGSFLPATLDPETQGYSLVQFGLGETLTRVTADQQVEPWLAESVTSDDHQIWTVSLRAGATFWDGTPVTAEVVVASLERSLETIPGAAQFLDPEAEIAAIDDITVEIRLPEPAPTLPNNLATFHLLIALEDDEALGGYQLTGPYEPVEHVPDDVMRLVGYDGHWNGAPPFDAIEVRLVRDANARMLGLQSGEIDMVNQVPTELAGSLGPGIEVGSAPSTRVHHVILNHQRAPFDDPAAREAFAIAIDRDILNEVALSGLGTTTSSIFPPGVGLPTIDQLSTDQERAGRLLDDAGWVVGDDGVRAKGDQRLSFTLYTYPSRPELPIIAVSIQDQLKPLGFEIEVRQSEDIVATLEALDFEASLFSVNLAPIGDPRYAFNVTLVEGAIYNYGGYRNARLEEIIADLLVEPDPAERDRLVVEAQEIVDAEFANVYLLAAPRVVAYREESVAPFPLHPNDLYQIDETLRPNRAGR